MLSDKEEKKMIEKNSDLNDGKTSRRPSLTAPPQLLTAQKSKIPLSPGNSKKKISGSPKSKTKQNLPVKTELQTKIPISPRSKDGHIRISSPPRVKLNLVNQDGFAEGYPLMKRNYHNPKSKTPSPARASFVSPRNKPTTGSGNPPTPLGFQSPVTNRFFGINEKTARKNLFSPEQEDDGGSCNDFRPRKWSLVKKDKWLRGIGISNAIKEGSDSSENEEVLFSSKVRRSSSTVQSELTLTKNKLQELEATIKEMEKTSTLIQSRDMTKQLAENFHTKMLQYEKQLAQEKDRNERLEQNNKSLEMLLNQEKESTGRLKILLEEDISTRIECLAQEIDIGAVLVANISLLCDTNEWVDEVPNMTNAEIVCEMKRRTKWASELKKQAAELCERIVILQARDKKHTQELKILHENLSRVTSEKDKMQQELQELKLPLSPVSGKLTQVTTNLRQDIEVANRLRHEFEEKYRSLFMECTLLQKLQVELSQIKSHLQSTTSKGQGNEKNVSLWVNNWEQDIAGFIERICQIDSGMSLPTPNFTTASKITSFFSTPEASPPSSQLDKQSTTSTGVEQMQKDDLSKKIIELDLRRSEAEADVDRLMDECFNLAEVNKSLGKKVDQAQKEKEGLRAEKLQLLGELDRLYSSQILNLEGQSVTKGTTEMDKEKITKHRRRDSMDTCITRKSTMEETISGTELQNIHAFTSTLNMQTGMMSRSNSSADVTLAVVPHPRKPVDRLSVQDVCQLLIKLELPIYVELFRKEGINGRRLSSMEKRHLEKLGVTWLHQRLLIQALEKFKSHGGVPVNIIQGDEGCSLM